MGAGTGGIIRHKTKWYTRCTKSYERRRYNLFLLLPTRLGGIILRCLLYVYSSHSPLWFFISGRRTFNLIIVIKVKWPMSNRRLTSPTLTCSAWRWSCMHSHNFFFIVRCTDIPLVCHYCGWGRGVDEYIDYLLRKSSRPQKTSLTVLPKWVLWHSARSNSHFGLSK